MKYLLDTNIDLDAFRSQENKDQFRQAFFPLLPSTFYSAVVACELHVNAWNGRTRDALGEFIHPLERAGRVVTPTFDDWVEASTIVTEIERKDRKLAVKDSCTPQRHSYRAVRPANRCNSHHKEQRRFSPYSTP